MKTELSAQQQLNQRAHAISATPEVFSGWIVTMEDGTVYIVRTIAQLYDLIDGLEKEANDKHSDN